MTSTQIAVCGEWMQTHFDAFGIYRHLSSCLQSLPRGAGNTEHRKVGLIWQELELTTNRGERPEKPYSQFVGVIHSAARPVQTIVGH
jgi:hypothetical protein